MDGLKKLGGLMAAVVMIATLAGCQGDRMAEENQRYAQQNRELQAQLNQERAARDAAENERARLASEQARLAAERTTPPTGTTGGLPAAPAAGQARANEPFGGIAGVEQGTRGRDIELRLASDILFAPGKATLSDAAKSSLAKVAGVIRQQYPSQNVTVEGHTDSDPIRKSNWRDNQHLSEARAQAVSSYLAQQGVSSSQMSTLGYGSTKPRETKALSRRVEIIVQQ
ncbi:MAG: OmpA family protein [Phycisphaeraceae bacterium]